MARQPTNIFGTVRLIRERRDAITGAAERVSTGLREQRTTISMGSKKPTEQLQPANIPAARVLGSDERARVSGGVVGAADRGVEPPGNRWVLEPLRVELDDGEHCQWRPVDCLAFAWGPEDGGCSVG
ncbi:hypothetical protein LINPERPRIM_LOCUS30136 [Linum perenne]